MKFFRKPLHGHLSLFVFVVLVPFLAGIAYLKNTPFYVFDRVADARLKYVEEMLESERASALRHAKEISGLESLRKYIAEDDVPRIIPFIQEEKEKRGITFVVPVGEKGFALTRVPVTSRSGEYSFQLYPWGRATARGESVAMVGLGRVFPLILVGAHPIMSEATATSSPKVKGAIFAGYWLNDAYSRQFKEKYLMGGEILFYRGDVGTVGTSVRDEAARNLLTAYFNSGTDLVLNELTEIMVRFSGKTYFVENLAFAGLDESAGAVLLLPYPVAAIGALFALVVGIVPLAIAMAVHRYMRRHDRAYLHLLRQYPYLRWLILVLFFTAYAGFLIIVERRTIELKDPPLAIYNSVLRLDPESNLIDISREQKVAVKIASGGESVNAVEFFVEYDPKAARVEDVLINNSVCRQEHFLGKEIDNEKGEVWVSCIVPNGFSSGADITVAELLVQPLREGSLSLKFRDAQVFANDGLATAVLRKSVDASYHVRNFMKDQQKGAVPMLFSDTHSNPERWYKKNLISVTWPVTEGSSYFYSLDDKPDSVPSEQERTFQGFIQMRTPGDGVYYVHVSAEKDGKLKGEVAHHKVKVDTVPPAVPVIKTSATRIKAGEIIRVEIEGGDALSGLQSGFYYKIGNSIRLPTAGKFSVVLPTPGKHLLTVRAFDNAGNWVDSSIPLVAY